MVFPLKKLKAKRSRLSGTWGLMNVSYTGTCWCSKLALIFKNKDQQKKKSHNSYEYFLTLSLLEYFFLAQVRFSMSKSNEGWLKRKKTVETENNSFHLYTSVLWSFLYLWLSIGLCHTLQNTLNDYESVVSSCLSNFCHVLMPWHQIKPELMKLNRPLFRNTYFAADKMYWSTTSVFQNVKMPLFGCHCNKNYFYLAI